MFFTQRANDLLDNSSEGDITGVFAKALTLLVFRETACDVLFNLNGYL
jgi:hypothetical protein